MTPKAKETAIRPLVRTHVMVPKDTHEALHRLAEEGRRSFSREVRNALEAYVAAAEEWKEPQ